MNRDHKQAGEFDVESWANPHVAAMSPYVPGMQPSESGWVKLNTNELPFPPSPRVVEAIRGEVGEDASRLRLYPNPTSAPLREALAKRHGLSPAGVVIGNGADDILNLLMRVFTGPERAAGMTVPSYSLYKVLAAAQAAPMREVPFTADMALPVSAIRDCGAALFLLTNPNAPTGVGFAREEIRAAALDYPGIFVVDETYAPFACDEMVPLLGELPNLVVVRSFSKAFGLAGLRVGYALASPAIANLLDRVRDSYNLDRLAQVGARAALEDVDYYAGVINQVKSLREACERWYAELGWFCYPSAANFHFVRPVGPNGAHGPEVAGSFYRYLADQKILVRCFPGHPLTESFLRISVGSAEEMARLREAVERWQMA